MTHKIDERMACRRQQPSFRILWYAVSWPSCESSYQRIAESVLGAGYVACVRGKVSHQAAVRLSGHSLYDPVSVLRIASIHPVDPRRMASGASGRTSTAPIEAPGH